MIRSALLLLSLACAIPAALLAGEEPPAPAPAAPDKEFVEKFAANLLVAEWLAAYDVTAWYASDAFLSLPEGEQESATNFICYEEKGEWHAVFGRFEEEKQTFTRMAHFRVDSPKEVVRIADLSSRDFDVPFLRALTDSGPRYLAANKAANARYNPYLRPVEGGIELWALPPVTEGFRILHGVSYRWRYSADGKEFKGEDRYGTELRAVTPAPDKVTVIGDPDDEVPNVADIFVVLRFGARFAGLGIVSRSGVTMFLDGLWTHDKLEDVPEESKPPPKDEPAKEPAGK